MNEGTKGQEENRSETLFALAKLFGIRIVAGEKLVQESMIGFTASMLGENVPEPFYRGFPQSVRELTSDQLLFDQIIHYIRTYWLGDFSEPGHSIFEKDIERSAFKENVQIKEFSIVTENEAVSQLAGIVEDLLTGTRPLSDDQFELVKTFISEYDYKVTDIASKNTCVKLLRNTRDIRYADYMKLSDVIKLVDDINFEEYGNENIRKLNLRSKDRKFIESVIDCLIDQGKCDIRSGSINVAGETSMDFLMQYFHVTEIINVASFFEMMAEEVVDDISEAEVVVTNKHVECEEGVEVIREYDFEKMIRYMNQR